MFRLLKELSASRTLEKVLMREETRQPITKNVNSISLIRIKEGENGENNMQIDKSIMEPGKSDKEGPLERTDMKNEVKRKTDDKPAKIKAVIKFDKGTISLRSGKSKISFQGIPEPNCRIEKGIKNDIEPIAPMMTVNRLVLEWEEKIRLQQEKEMKFDQRRSKIFNNEHPALKKEECEVEDKGEVT
ncbi:hypothetical protein Tco_1019265 [Tanacetum coccineum]|uniref:Uncharacterized protein n=1 Tax=Tanacetum coccineum TaxID=301880 RepID=A0ABQ5FY44_9ASTR